MPRIIKSIKMDDLLKLTKSEFVYGRLIKAGVDPEVRTRIVNSWREHKEKEKQARYHARVIDKPWRELLALLRAECARTYSACVHCPPENTQKTLALQEYLDCLRRHRDRIRLLALTSAGRTPRDYAVAKKLPNNGAHWPDWIDTTQRERITALFNSLPPVAHGRPFHVFKQTAHTPQTEARINKMRASIMQAMSACETKIDLYPAHRPFHEEELRGLKAAMAKLDAYEQDPSTLDGRALMGSYWGLLPQEHRDALVQINRPTDKRRAPPEPDNDEKLFG